MYRIAKKRKTLFVKEKFLMRFSFRICKLESTTTSTVLFVQENLQQGSYKWVSIENSQSREIQSLESRSILSVIIRSHI